MKWRGTWGGRRSPCIGAWKFYDSVSPDLLVSLATQLQYPPLHLYMGMLVHAAPRVLRTSAGCLSTGVQPDTSIIAGDGQSNSWARAMVHQLLQSAHDAYMPKVRISQFVDDLAQRGEAGEDEDLVAPFIQAATHLSAGVQSLRLKFSETTPR